MEHFSYSFAVSMLHSLWQMALLVFFYVLFNGIFPRRHPLQKRNLLYGILLVQLTCSIGTFLVYYNNPFGLIQFRLTGILSAVLPDQGWLHQYSPFLLYGYLLIVFYKFLSLLYHWSSFKNRVKQQLVKPSVELKLFTNLKAFQFGIKRKVTLWYSHTISTPMTFGFLKPVILMPVALVNSITVQEAEALIVHELTHIRNYDYLLNWLLLTLETIYCFNPFVEYITRQLKLEREKTCDTQVLHFNYCYISYAEALLKSARYSSKYIGFQMTAAQKHSQLIKRIRFFSDTRNQSFPKNNLCRLSLAGGILAILLVNLLLVTQLKVNKNILKIKPLELSATFIKGNEFQNTFIIAASTAENPVIETKGNILKESPAQSQPMVSTSSLQVPTQLEDQPDLAEVAAPFIAMPVAYDMNMDEPVITREVILNEEKSGKTVTMAYKLQLINGEWVSEPLWMITEIKPLTDSLNQQLDSVVHLINSIQ